MSESRTLLLANANRIELDLARNLLAEAGIPCVIEGPDFDMAELGRAGHDMLRGQNLYVPASAEERARALLAEAWTDDGEEGGGGSA